MIANDDDKRLDRSATPLGFEHVYIIGIAGSATRGLARWLVARGVRVSGSDLSLAAESGAPRSDSARALAELRRFGIDARSGHDAANLVSSVDHVVYSAAVPTDNPERIEAVRRALPLSTYAEFVGRVLDAFRGIAIAGTHGKTSTSGFLVSCFLAAGRDPNLLIGGLHPGIGASWRSGSDAEFIIEACEFNRSFHCLRPDAGIITNLELDHPDIYHDDDEIVTAFRAYIDGFADNGVLVLGVDSPQLRDWPVPPSLRVVRTSTDRSLAADYHAQIIKLGATPRFRVLGGSRDRRMVRDIELRVPGRHNVMNALAAFALAVELGVPPIAACLGLESFPGIDRRFQLRGHLNGAPLIDDYAHHPTEVFAAVAAARDKYRGKRIVALFQPHQLGRLTMFGSGFAAALASADDVCVTPAYSVREDVRDFAPDLVGRLTADICGRGSCCAEVGDLTAAESWLTSRLDPDSVGLVLGAGDVTRVSDAVAGYAEFEAVLAGSGFGDAEGAGRSRPCTA